MALATAATGIGAPGTIHRLDEVPLGLRPPLEQSLPAGEDVLHALSRRIAERTGRRYLRSSWGS